MQAAGFIVNLSTVSVVEVATRTLPRSFTSVLFVLKKVDLNRLSTDSLRNSAHLA